jgi:benzoate 4-monooxygenase
MSNIITGFDTNNLHNVNVKYIVSAILTAVLSAHVIPWLLDEHGIRAIPGPWLAKFSDLWLGRVAAQGHRSEVVHDVHKQYGIAQILLAHPTEY